MDNYYRFLSTFFVQFVGQAPVSQLGFGNQNFNTGILLQDNLQTWQIKDFKSAHAASES
jgi:hypothetical protein